MLSIVFWAVLAAAAAGLAVKYLLDWKQSELEVSWKEFAIGMAAISIVVAPLVALAGWHIAKNNVLKYNEYLNGWELQAIATDIPCSRDGPCRYEYDCDPYIVIVCESCNCDSKGNCSTCCHPETRYHSCPYVTVETNYDVKTTLGGYTIDTHRFPVDPQAHRWRRSERIPESVIARAGVGEPQFWTAVKLRIAAGRPGHVTKRGSYDNYILASDHTILKQYSGDVARFSGLKLLPPLARGIHDFYWADRVVFVGFSPQDGVMWQHALEYLNAALGTELQGDLRLVVVKNDAVSQNPDAYALALKAHWQNHNAKDIGKDALSKNSIVVILGTTDGATVAWARAFTGMPLGNEEMLVALQHRLKGAALTPSAVIGNIEGRFAPAGAKPPVQGMHGSGVIERVVWGLENPATKFKRFSMSGKNKDDIGSGFLYLKNEVQLTGGQKLVVWFATFFMCMGVWVACAFIGQRAWKEGQRRGNYPRYY